MLLSRPVCPPARGLYINYVIKKKVGYLVKLLPFSIVSYHHVTSSLKGCGNDHSIRQLQGPTPCSPGDCPELRGTARYRPINFNDIDSILRKQVEYAFDGCFILLDHW